MRPGDGAADPFERMQATARPPHEAITRPVDPARFDGRHIVDLGYKRNGAGFLAFSPLGRGAAYEDLYFQPAAIPLLGSHAASDGGSSWLSRGSVSAT